MTTPADLYKMEPERVTDSMEHLCGCHYDFLKEVGIDFYEHKYFVKSDKIEVKFLKDWSFDGRRVWQLATVWFEGIPVMVTQTAGREGDDYSKRFVTNQTQFARMCVHIRRLIDVDEVDDLVSEDDEIEGLTEFYGNSLNGHFERYYY